ncbi:MAG: hypothetical protein AT712_02270 [Caldivirga sp. CIS_19]|jgi:ABC-type dipeptide transport system, periplasmic component|nr:MAG: hypothetical protein AT712_02270 [Caldivirga sp. CIS_19]
MPYGGGVSRTVIAVIAIVIVVAIVIGIYYALTIKPTPPKPVTNVTKPVTTVSCSLPSNTSVIISIENEPPNSVDPAVGFYAGEDEIMTNVYQGLIMFNYTSINSFVPIIASSWQVAPNYTVYVFNIRHGVYFANGDPVNATTFWLQPAGSTLEEPPGRRKLLHKHSLQRHRGYNNRLCYSLGCVPCIGLCHWQ